jgi:type I restriction enzyme S subunit
VLKAAVEGRLVEQDPGEEPAEELLRELGKLPLTGQELQALPEGWCWIRIGDLFHISYGLSESLSKTSPDNELDVAVIRIPNITPDGTLDLTELKYFPVEAKTRDKLLLRKDDILFNWRNAPKWIGRTAVFNRDGLFVNASFLLRLRPIGQGYCNFISMFINHLRISGYFMTRVNNAVNQANFNGSKTSQVPIALPPLEEQYRIMEEVERRLSVAGEIEATVKTGLRRSERLRQAILKRAFEGKLV